MSDEADMAVCEACGAKVPFEQSVSTYDGECDLCHACYAGWEAEACTCDHVWSPHRPSNGRVCERCSLVEEPAP